ncbi:MAG: hypothetical protein ACOYOL_11130 [Chthoniobacterales bacterium]|jgi:hypothetical protein
MKVGVAALVLSVCVCAAGPIVREEGAIYLEDFSVPAMRLSLREAAPCYFDRPGRRYAGTLRFPQFVRLDAVAPDGMLRVRGNAQQGGVVAWVEPRFLQPPPEGLIEALGKAEERRRKVDALIANNEVAIGMSLEEVTRSLGKPQKKSSRTGREGSTQVYEYIKYDIIPQTSYTPAFQQSIVGFRPDPRDPRQQPRRVVVNSGFGYNASTIYLKVPVGSVTVSFTNGVAESIEQSEGTLAGASAALVVPPVNVVW